MSENQPPVNAVAARLGEGTRQPGQARAEADRVPALTIVCHPDLTRVGERSVLLSLMLGQRVNVSRGSPDFHAPDAGQKRALEDAYVSRKPLWLRSVEGGVSVDAADAAGSAKLDGQELSGSVTVPHQQLDRGVVLELAGRVSVLLHNVEPTPLVTGHGLLGGSEALRGLYLDIESAASHEGPVVVSGEPGSGKELVSRAVHERSARSSGPFVAVNLATLPAENAAAELFGYEPGAFAGAAEASPGLIRQAHLGSFFMDEYGETSAELQAMLLRVIETGELRPLGAAAPVQVDVRWIAATDPDLKVKKGSGTFRKPLWYRLGAPEIQIPPLRERREDIPRLWVHFLREELGGTEKLAEARDAPLVSAELMSALMNHSWPGNVRELRHAAIRFALELSRDGVAVAAAAVSERLSAVALGSGVEVRPHAPSREPRLLSRRAPESIDDATLTAALHDNRWKIGATAKQLGVSRHSLYRLIEHCAGLRKAKDLELPEVMEALERCGHDVERMAASLQVSERALRLRMKDLGVS